MSQNLSLFDTSDYPTTHPLHSKTNCKVIGKFKDECNGAPAIEFVGLRAKMYSILLPNDHSKSVAKGVKKSYAKKCVKHEQYLNTLTSNVTSYATFNSIRSRNHQLETIKTTKVCLSSFDDKRYILPDSFQTLAHGHYRIKSIHSQ